MKCSHHTPAARGLVAGFALLGAIAASPTSVRAASTGACIPPATGAPWFGGAPDITDVSALGDLRWTGAFSFNWSTGATTDTDHQMLFVPAASTDPTYGGTLYMFWRSHTPEANILNTEGVRFGLTVTDKASGNTVQEGVTIYLNQHNAPPSTTLAEKPRYTEIVQRDGNGDKSVGETFLGDGRVMTYIIPQTDTMGTVTMTWVVTAAIPLRHAGASVYDSTGKTLAITDATPGLFADDTLTQWGTASPTLPGSANFWTSYIQQQSSSSSGSLTAAVYYPTTISATTDVPGTTTQTLMPNIGKWATVQFVAPSTPDPNPAAPVKTLCKQPGLYITSSDIYKSNTSPGQFELAGFTGLGTSASPFARASNTVGVNVHNSGATVDTSKIHAHFLIAPTGSATVQSNLWRNLDTLGNKIVCAAGTSGSSCSPVYAANGITSDYIVGNVTGTAGPTTGDFALQSTTQWTPDWSYLCDTYWDDDPTSGHLAESGFTRFGSQCSGVPWQATTSAVALAAHQCLLTQLYSDDGTSFSQGSAFTNMHLGHASNFIEDALIDSSGLPPIPGATGRWFYLVVDTRNMPATVPTGPVVQLLPRVTGVSPTGVAFYANRGELGYDQAAQLAPTLIVHVYHETGKTFRAFDGTKETVLEEQPAYGYFIQHNGSLVGWRNILTGATQIGPNLYRVWIPNGGSTTVTTSIGALEKACTNTPSPLVKVALTEISTVLQKANSPLAATVQSILANFDVECWDFEMEMAQLQKVPCLKPYIPLLQWILTTSGCTC